MTPFRRFNPLLEQRQLVEICPKPKPGFEQMLEDLMIRPFVQQFRRNEKIRRSNGDTYGVEDPPKSDMLLQPKLEIRGKQSNAVIADCHWVQCVADPNACPVFPDDPRLMDIGDHVDGKVHEN